MNIESFFFNTAIAFDFSVLPETKEKDCTEKNILNRASYIQWHVPEFQSCFHICGNAEIVWNAYTLKKCEEVFQINCSE